MGCGFGVRLCEFMVLQNLPNKKPQKQCLKKGVRVSVGCFLGVLLVGGEEPYS